MRKTAAQLQSTSQVPSLASLLKKDTHTKPTVVEVIRHVRYVDQRSGDIDSRGGLTAICMLDYTENEIRVYPAICQREDNYEKSVGIEIARQAFNKNLGYVIPMDDLNNGVSLSECIVHPDLDSFRWLNKESQKKFEVPFMKCIGLRKK